LCIIFNFYLIMMKTSTGLVLIVSQFILFFLTSCGAKSSKLNQERDAILKEISSYKKNLPYAIPGTTILITDIAIDNDIIIYTCKVGSEDWEAMSLATEVSNSDRNMARIINNVPSDAIDLFIKHGLGIKYLYLLDETGETLMEIEISAEKMKEIRDKVKMGAIQPFSMIEICKMELAKMEIPAQLDEGVWLTDAYIEGSYLYYVATVEYEIEASDLTLSDLSELKESCIEGLKDEGLVMLHKKSIINENIHFVYIFKDNRGKEYARVDIGPDDL